MKIKYLQRSGNMIIRATLTKEFEEKENDGDLHILSFGMTPQLEKIIDSSEKIMVKVNGTALNYQEVGNLKYLKKTIQIRGNTMYRFSKIKGLDTLYLDGMEEAEIIEE